MQKILNFAQLLIQSMRLLRSFLSILRKAILIGWAFAIVWIYLGNLVNFHQNRIWGKQLIPVACYSTRAKEKDALSSAKNDRNLQLFDSGQHFDFSAPHQVLTDSPYFRLLSTSFAPIEQLVIHQRFQALSFRGPPSA